MHFVTFVGSGKAKKNGGGGRFTWGKMLDPFPLDDVHSAVDSNDPNWDSELEDECCLVEERTVQIVAYKKAVVDILMEYFDSGNVEEALQSLVELDHPELGYYFVKRAILQALDRHGKEREMASVVLSRIYSEALSMKDVEKGFSALVEELPDMLLDVPDSIELLAYFTCRAITDDVLPPAFVTDYCCA